MYEMRSEAKTTKLDKQLVDRKYSKDSFDRFGDDLCQLLLSYLTINDKIKFECISKQWQTLVFNTQRKLILNLNVEDSIQTFPMTDELYKNCDKIHETLFKKFKFIKELEIKYSIDDKTVDLITNYCQDLERVQFCVLYFTVSNESFIQIGRTFGQKFANTLKYIDIEDRADNKLLEIIMALAKNLTAIKPMISFQQFLELNLFKLEEIVEIWPQSMTQMKTFSDKYCKQIKKLGLTLSSSFSDALKELSRFENLEDLKLIVYSGYGQRLSIDNQLLSIANNCDKINKLSLIFNWGLIHGKLLQVFGSFKALEHIFIHFTEQLEGSIGNIDFLKNCQNLKSLKLSFFGLNDNFYKDIDLYLPQLKSIEFDCSRSSPHCVTDNTLENLAKIQNLTKLFINCNKITISGIQKFIKNSPQIKTIHSNDRTISKKTIDAFIKRANNNEKIKYEFIPSDSRDEVFISKTHRIPHNLSVKKLMKK
jgi:hypothetical protein